MVKGDKIAVSINQAGYCVGVYQGIKEHLKQDCLVFENYGTKYIAKCVVPLSNILYMELLTDEQFNGWELKNVKFREEYQSEIDAVTHEGIVVPARTHINDIFPKANN